MAKPGDNPQCSKVEAADTVAQAGVQHQVGIGDIRAALTILAPKIQDEITGGPACGLQQTDASDFIADILQGIGMRKKKGLQTGTTDKLHTFVNQEGMNAGV